MMMARPRFQQFYLDLYKEKLRVYMLILSTEVIETFPCKNETADLSKFIDGLLAPLVYGIIITDITCSFI